MRLNLMEYTNVIVVRSTHALMIISLFIFCQLSFLHLAAVAVGA